MSFTAALTLIFITLKLTGVIDWSWLLVLLPMIIGLGFVGLVFAIAFFREL